MSHNPEKRTWRGRSYKKGGEPVVQLRADLHIADGPDAIAGAVDEATAAARRGLRVISGDVIEPRLRAEQVELPEEVGGEPIDYEALILDEQAESGDYD